jgi:hypothetical protein
MYCYTYINQFACIFNELQLWTHISSDHPNFLKTVAGLSNINLPKDIQNKLDDIHQKFMELYNRVLYLKKVVYANLALYGRHITNIKKLINEFLIYDTQALSLYPQLLGLGKDNKAWQELVKHIINEQTFMLELFKNLRQQIR